MKSLFVFLLCVSFFVGLNLIWGNQTLYFMPYEQKSALKSLTQNIRSAQESIDVSIYSFTNKEIAKAIRDVAKTGTRIRIIYDYHSNVKNDFSTAGYLSKYKNIKVCLLEGKRSKNNKFNGIMHQKLAIIDDRFIFIGSANWSKNAFENNYELLLKSDEITMIEKAKKYFEKMFAQCRPY